VVTTAITNLDIHDISRTARTYGVAGYYVINPMPAQRELAGRILSHWRDGYGSVYNPNRTDALSVLSVAATFEEAAADIEKRHGTPPRVVATAARRREGATGYAKMKELVGGDAPHVIVFGTGWGLTDEFLDGCDYVLEPITGPGEYNHLPVRAAVAIILDRLLGIGA
jgi:hypothetical protein